MKTVLEGTVDTGCSRLIVGDETNAGHDYALRRPFGLCIRYVPCTARRAHFANNQDALAKWVAEYPVGFGGKPGIIRLRVVKGRAPLLISVGFLEDLCGILDTPSGTIEFRKLGVSVSLRRSRDNPNSRQRRLPQADCGPEGYNLPRRPALKSTGVARRTTEANKKSDEAARDSTESSQSAEESSVSGNSTQCSSTPQIKPMVRRVRFELGPADHGTSPVARRA